MNKGFQTELTPDDMFSIGVIRLQQDYPFYASIIMRFVTREVCTDDVPSMGVNEWGQLFWNPLFVTELSRPELVYTLAHEVLHVVKGDMARQGDRNLKIWNIATDCIINDILNQECELEHPKWTRKLIEQHKNRKLFGDHVPNPGDVWGFCPDKYGDCLIAGKKYNCRNKSDEELYDELIKDCEVIEANFIQSNKQESGDGIHDGPCGQDYKQSHGGFDYHFPGNMDWEGNGVDGRDDPTGRNTQKEIWKKATVEACMEAKRRGKLPGFAESFVNTLLQPRIDWKTKIKTFVQPEIPYDYYNQKPNRKFYHTGCWFPTLYKENVRLMFSVDCSGSTASCRDMFVAEIKGITKAHPQVEARIVFWDTRVDPENDCEVNSNNVERVLKKLKIHDCNGGTALSAYTNYCKEKKYTSSVHVHLTDGSIESNPVLPPGKHLFVLCGECQSREIVEKYGEVVAIPFKKCGG